MVRRLCEHLALIASGEGRGLCVLCQQDEIEQLRATIAYMEDHADAPAIIRREARRALENKS
jgi:hypothetical protein